MKAQVLGWSKLKKTRCVVKCMVGIETERTSSSSTWQYVKFKSRPSICSECSIPLLRWEKTKAILSTPPYILDSPKLNYWSTPATAAAVCETFIASLIFFWDQLVLTFILVEVCFPSPTLFDRLIFGISTKQKMSLAFPWALHASFLCLFLYPAWEE